MKKLIAVLVLSLSALSVTACKGGAVAVGKLSDGQKTQVDQYLKQNNSSEISLTPTEYYGTYSGPIAMDDVAPKTEIKVTALKMSYEGLTQDKSAFRFRTTIAFDISHDHTGLGSGSVDMISDLTGAFVNDSCQLSGGVFHLFEVEGEDYASPTLGSSGLLLDFPIMVLAANGSWRIGNVAHSFLMEGTATPTVGALFNDFNKAIQNSGFCKAGK